MVQAYHDASSVASRGKLTACFLNFFSSGNQESKKFNPGSLNSQTQPNLNPLKQKCLYLCLNLFSFAAPFLLSFVYPKPAFVKKWKYVLPAIAATAIVFVAWSALYTNLGIWGFSERYTLGKSYFGVPLEEILFFVCIPYASLFVYFALNQLIEKDHLFPHQELISSVVIVLLLIFGGYYMHHLYTGVVFLVTAMTLTFIWLKLRVRFLGRFYLAFAVLLIPFLLADSILTGSFLDEPVVWYNSDENLGLRIGTIPIEDVVFAMLLFLVPVTIWEKLEEARFW